MKVWIVKNSQQECVTVCRTKTIALAYQNDFEMMRKKFYSIEEFELR